MSKIHSDVILEKMMSLHPKIIDLTLDRVFHLLDRLGNPEKSLPPVIHIAGTNGKGSTLAMIRAGLESAGHWVHAYTSPHLVRFHERIMLAGNLISEPQLASVLGECHAANDGGQITYFEITTCAAMLAMSRVPAAYTPRMLLKSPRSQLLRRYPMITRHFLATPLNKSPRKKPEY